ncbi:MAG: selenobiotic family peptide radical SAM maturase [Deltaproteobacteria bacterium]|nr:selenobiotic family peptide radical SAM maturase [Deltaproteobacteria bacterium]
MDITQLFPVSHGLVTEKTWETIKKIWNKDPEIDRFCNNLSTEKFSFPGLEFLPDLIRLEWAVDQARRISSECSPERISLNPSLQVLILSWKNLPLFIKKKDRTAPYPIEAGPEWVLIWLEPASHKLQVEAGSNEDLLVLKMLAEDLDIEEVARSGGLPIASVENMVDRAVKKGILIRPPSEIRRESLTFPRGEVTHESFFSAEVFTLQWHLTQLCDLHCRHCYDRSSKAALSLKQAQKILDDLKAFCRARKVKGHISFTGGNPFLHPDFFQIYQAAVEQGFSTAILGNPVSRKALEKITALEKPGFFQVSLEGLPEHNDYIRGTGHFDRTLAFLSLLKQLGIYSMVMLTLTRDNLPQVLPLAELLRGKTEAFFFNRLSRVGEGANLLLPDPEEYQRFLEAYLKASRENPLLGLKDNLFNILLYRKGEEIFGGCAGYGCSGAFNFLTLLPDGEVHACRKFPSPVGHSLHQSFEEIYQSEEAQRYRAGSQACSSCPIRPVCGGCLAVSFSLGLNIFEERDPFCFFR